MIMLLLAATVGAGAMCVNEFCARLWTDAMREVVFPSHVFSAMAAHRAGELSQRAQALSSPSSMSTFVLRVKRVDLESAVASINIQAYG